MSGIRVLKTSIEQVEATGGTISGKVFRRDNVYRFTVVGEAPADLHINDLVQMIEARFEGQPAVRLDHTRDKRLEQMKKKLDDELTFIKVERERLAQLSKKLDTLQRQLNKREADLNAKLNNELALLQQKKGELQREIGALTEALEKYRREWELLVQIGADGFEGKDVTPMAEEAANGIIRAWRDSLADYENPLASDYMTLEALLAKVITRVAEGRKP